MAHIQTQYGGLWKPQDLTLDKISSQKMFVDNIDSMESFIKEGKQKVYPSVKTIADLKAIDTSDTALFITGMLIMVHEVGIFCFNRNTTGGTSTDSDDIIVPTTGGGEWISTNINSAPAGFGLGESEGKTINALDDIDGFGFYRITTDSGIAPDTNSNWGAVFVGANINYGTLIASRAGGFIATRTKSGVWADRWEWVNPPMEIGVEYLTTERINGKAVYNKNVNGVIQYRLDGESDWKPYADVVGAYSKTETDSLLQKKANQNLLINWDFRNPIDQRGGYVVPPGVRAWPIWGSIEGEISTTQYYTATMLSNRARITVDGTIYYTDKENAIRGYTGAGYGIDRWKSYSNLTVLIEPDNITIRNDTDNTGYFGQTAESDLWDALVGKTVTMSALTGNGTLYFCTGTYGTNISFPVGDGVNAYMWPTSKEPFDFSIASGASIKVSAVKLELGTHQTLAHQDENGNWVLNEINFQHPTTKKGTIKLSTNWSGDSSPYTQTVTIPGTTSNSKVDLQPDSTSISQMAEDGTVALYVSNDNGVLTANAVGEKPTAEMTIQATITEVI